jgi:opacity protein-like surface antigen
MKTTQKLRFFSLSTCLTLSLFAASHACAANVYVDSQFGVLVNPMNHDNLIAGLTPSDPDQNYKTNTSSNAVSSIGVRSGLFSQINTRWSLEYGLGYQVNTQQDLQGHYYVINGPTPDATYQYTLNLQSLVADTRLYFNPNCALSYFVGAGLGLGFVHNSAVSMQVLPDSGDLSDPIYSKPSQDIRAVYTLTAGMQWHLNNHWHLETGFTQSYFGRDYILMNTGTQSQPIYTKTDMGAIRPWQLWLGVGYQF